jgi:hypothetical protein
MLVRQAEEETMIVGGHVMLQSRDEKADKAFFRDVLKLDHVDAGEGFLIFALPPSEFAVHDGGDAHQFYLMCESMAAFTAAMTEAGIAFDAPANRGWGTLTAITLPGGGKLGVYEPHHPRPHKAGKDDARAARRKKSAERRTAKRAAKKVKKKERKVKRKAKRA